MPNGGPFPYEASGAGEAPRYISYYTIDKLASPLPRMLGAAVVPSDAALGILSGLAHLLGSWSHEVTSTALTPLLDDAAALASRLSPVKDDAGIGEKAHVYDQYFGVFRCAPPLEAFAIGQAQALRAVIVELERGSSLSQSERCLLLGGLGASARIARDGWWRWV